MTNVSTQLCKTLAMVLACVVFASSYAQAELFPIDPKKEKPQKTKTYRSKRGKIVVETYAPKMGVPRARVLTKHYELYTELTKETGYAPEEMGKILEAEFDALVRFTTVKPTLKHRWQVALYESSRTMTHYSGHQGQGIFMFYSKIAHVHKINGPLFWTRTMFTHEVSHQFHYMTGIRNGEKHKVPGSCRFNFITEGFATVIEGNRWDPKTETLHIGAPLPGRTNSGIQKIKKYPRTFEGLIMAHDPPRDITFNIMMFLIHEKTPQAKKLLSDPREPKVAWKATFGTLDMPQSFWDEYDAFAKKIGDTKLTDPHLPKDLIFTTWPDMLKKHKRKMAKK